MKEAPEEQEASVADSEEKRMSLWLRKRKLRTLDLSATQLNHTARNTLKPLTVLAHLSNLNLSSTEIPPGDTDNIIRMFKKTNVTF